MLTTDFLRKLLTASWLVPLALAQTPQRAAAPAPAAAAVASAPNAAFLKITLDPSRTPISMDTQASISAEIKNVSTVPVRLWENETVFVSMPETRVYGNPQETIQGCATFPTQGNVRPLARPARGYDILIQPDDTTRVFWDMTMNGCTGQPLPKLSLWGWPPHLEDWAKEKWQRAVFAPGTYKVYLNVVFYPEDKGPYHTTTEGTEIQFSASQQMVLAGAFLGGLLAYVIKLYYGVPSKLTVSMESPGWQKFFGNTEWLIAGLTGAALVILASRLPDSFPIKVTANDFWGATTLGFAFQWIGVKLLEKLPGMSSGGPDNPPNPGPAPTGPAPGGNPAPPAR